MHFQLYMGSQLGVSLHDVSIFITYPAGMDYTTLITTLTFSVAMPTQVVTIPILDDLIVESSKSFSVTLTTTDPAVTLNIQTATVTIRGMIMGNIYYCTNAAHVVGNTNSISQPGITIGFNSTVISVSEGTSNVSITVSIQSGILARNTTVAVFTVNSLAHYQGK